MRFVIYATIPLVSALIGWLTNCIAVKMIFRPRKPVRIFGYELIGLIPKRKADLARKIGETVERELISHRDIQEVVKGQKFQNAMVEIIRKKIDDFIYDNLGSNPLFALILSTELTTVLRELLVDEIRGMIPDSIDMLVDKLEANVNFRDIVRRKIEGFELNKLEEVVYTIAARELKAIEVFGGVLGFLVGIVQVAIIVAGGLYG